MPVDPEAPKQPAAPFTDPRQQRIYRRLLLLGPGPAAFYKDASQLIAAPQPLPTTTHLVGHLLREIESALRDVLEVVVDVPEKEVHEARGQGKGQQAEVLAILRGLDVPKTDVIAQAWLRLCERQYGLHGMAHRQGLDLPRPLDSGFKEFWGEMEAVLDVVLDRLEARYAGVIALLDELLEKEVPTAGDVKRLAQHVPNNAVPRGHFFDQLESVEWLAPLKEAGFFRQPPQPEPDVDEQTFRLPGWPESRYLARRARERPADVLQIILEANDTTNARVHADYIDAALAMPPNMAASIAPKAAEWLTSSIGPLLLTEKTGDLVVHLAKGGETSTAIQLGAAMLALSQGPQRRGLSLQPEPIPLIEREFYGEALEKLSSVLMPTAGEGWLNVLCDLLCDAVRFSVPDQEQREAGEDGSGWWRRAIEGHAQNEPLHYVSDGLVDAVRDTADELAAHDVSSLPQIVAALERRRWKVFRRIALHLLRQQPEASQQLIADRLADRGYFEDTTYHHEYYLLIQEQFANLETGAQATVLGWIAEGPNRAAWSASFQEQFDREPSEGEWEDHLASWHFRLLHPIRGALTGDWRERYNQLAARFPEPEHPEFLVYGTAAVWSGFPSPKTVADLRAMAIPDLVRFLAVWEPPATPLGPSSEGLGRNLTALIAEESERFALAAALFQGLDPTYVRGVLDGLTQALEKGRSFEWPGVLRLAEWVVQQPRDRVDRTWQAHDADPDWGWARKAIARLLGKALVPGDKMIPIDRRAHVWRVLEPLTEDPEPTPAHEAQYGGANMDPATLSINTVRGDAMHTAVRYGLWVRNHFERQPDAEQRLAAGFDEMPELRDALERHLDPTQDPSPAVHSVYGQWFPLLALMDGPWADREADSIFPRSTGARTRWDAAWNAYVSLARPYDNTFPRLREQYIHAVELLGSGTAEGNALSGNPEEDLAEHLIILYWRGRLELRGPLLRRFYERASPNLRGHAMEFLGRSLIATDGQIDEEILHRLRALWEWRLSAGQTAGDKAAFGPELAAFGWWFRSAKFDQRWAITQLKHSIEFGPWARRESSVVMARLAEAAGSLPTEAVECASLLVESDAAYMAIVGHRKEFQELLQAALASGVTEAVQNARELVNRLVARGHVEFRQLLRDN